MGMGAWRNGPALLVLAGDPRSEPLVRQIEDAGGQARVIEVSATDLTVAPSEWLVIPPPGVPGADPLTQVAHASAGVLAPRRAAWMRDWTVPIALYGSDPAFVWENARLTGEGALAWALSRTRRTLRGARALVYGFGRVGLAVGMYLDALGTVVTVLCRDPDERGQAGVLGFAAQPIGADHPPCDLVVNTIPVPVVDEAAAAGFGAKTPVLELASSPGGFSEGAQVLLGGRLERLSGLPGRVAPETAATVLGEALFRALGPHRWVAARAEKGL